MCPALVDGVDVVENQSGRVLIIGFGRFAQVVAQPLLARDVDVSIIENDVEMIQAAATFGFKVYYGDGSRLDILHAAGAGSAELVVYAADDQEAGVKLAEIMRADFPLVPVLAKIERQGALVDAGGDIDQLLALVAVEHAGLAVDHAQGAHGLPLQPQRGSMHSM